MSDNEERAELTGERSLPLNEQVFERIDTDAVGSGTAQQTIDTLVLENRRYREAMDALQEQIILLGLEARAGELAKESFLNHLSHELRTPLTAIIGLTELIRMESHGKVGHDKYREYLKDILQSGQLLLDHLNRLLELSKSEFDYRDMEREPANVEKVINNAISVNSTIAAECGVGIKLQLSKNVPCVWRDHAKLSYAVAGVVENGIKYSPKFGVIAVDVLPYEGCQVVVQISDDGPGMSTEAIERAFQMMGPGNSLRADRKRGIGVGLAHGRRILERHGGSLAVESAVGMGTTVVIELPPCHDCPHGMVSA